MTTRPAICKWRQTEPQLILYAVRWYLRYSLSLRDVEELLLERCLEADRTTVWRWVGVLLAAGFTIYISFHRSDERLDSCFS